METFKRRIWNLRRQSLTGKEGDEKLLKNIDQWWRQYNVLMLDSGPFFQALIIFGLIINVAFMFAYHTCYKTNLSINFQVKSSVFCCCFFKANLVYRGVKFKRAFRVQF